MKNLIKYITFLTLLFSFVSCEEKQKEIPSNVISQEKLVEVITEIELAQALIKLKFANQDTINSQQLFEEVYNNFEITEENYNKSLSYYSQDPKLLEEMYVKVINNLSIRQTEFQNK